MKVGEVLDSKTKFKKKQIEIRTHEPHTLHEMMHHRMSRPKTTPQLNPSTSQLPPHKHVTQTVEKM